MSCQKYYLSLTDKRINQNSLASTYVGTPDKRQHEPPIGQFILVDWRIPQEILSQKPVIDLYILFGNYTEKKIEYPIKYKAGYVTYKDVNEEYADTEGIITYRADIRLKDGTIYKSWDHQLWVNLIVPEEDSYEVEQDIAWLADKSNFSVNPKSMQESVIDNSGSIDSEGND